MRQAHGEFVICGIQSCTVLKQRADGVQVSVQCGKVKGGSSIVAHIDQFGMQIERSDVATARRAHEFLDHCY